MIDNQQNSNYKVHTAMHVINNNCLHLENHFDNNCLLILSTILNTGKYARYA